MDSGGSSPSVVDVHDCAELQAMATNLTGHYRLANDINCQGLDSGDGKGFMPIGTKAPGSLFPFEGHFDGAGHVIRNLNIDRPEVNAVGLFGWTMSAVLERVGLENFDVAGGHQVGALVGIGYQTTIQQVFVGHGTVTASGDAGGIVGWMVDECTLVDSYSLADVHWGWGGGLVGAWGAENSHGSNLYSAGTATAPFLGSIDESSTVTASLFDCDVAGGCENIGGTSTTNLRTQSLLESLGWNFETVWRMPPDGYPCLRWQSACGDSSDAGVDASLDAEIDASTCVPNGNDDDCDGVDDDCDGLSDGTYDLAFNGGGATVLEFTRPGYLPIQRTLIEDWQSQAVVEDVAMTPVAPIAAVLNPSLSTVQPLFGPTVTDGDGTRRPLILFPPGTTPVAEVNGQTVPLSSLTMRLTEYTVGESGLRAMPGTLPPTTAYTYALELSVDEVGPTTDVRFARAVPFYLDNFLNFPIGAAMPVGYYDRKQGVWVPEVDGIVLRIHSIVDGMANLSVDAEDSEPASAPTLDALGIEPWERAHLAEHYEPGHTLWRVTVNHFTPWDLNAGFFAPQPPVPPKPTAEIQVPDCPTHIPGSIINCQGRALMEQIPVGTSGLTLHYQSDRTPGGIAHSKQIEIPLPTEYPEGARKVRLKVSVGRRQVVSAELEPGTPHYVYHWDGLDADGRPWPGPIELTVGIDFEMDIPYMLEARLLGGTSSSRRSFGGGGACPPGCDCLGGGGTTGAGLNLARVRQSSGSWWSFTRKKHRIGGYQSGRYGLGGWDITDHHYYSPLAKTLYLGNGRTRKLGNEPAGIQIFAGARSNVPVGDESYSPNAYGADLAHIFPRNIAASPDGTVYFRMNQPSRPELWRVSAKGDLDTVILPLLPDMTGSQILTVDPQGRLLMSHGQIGYSVYRLEQDTNGPVWTRLAGRPHIGDPDYVHNATYPEWVEGADIRHSQFEGIYDAAVTPDGRLYLAVQTKRTLSSSSWVWQLSVIMVRPDGHGETIFTSPYIGSKVLEVGRDGRLLIADNANRRILAIRPDGGSDVLAGGGTDTSLEPTLALSKWLGGVLDMAAAPDGSVYILDDRGQLAGASFGVIRVVRPDGTMQTICLSDVPRSPLLPPHLTSACGTPTSLTALPDGRVIVADTDRQLLAIETHVTGFPYRDPSTEPTPTWTEELVCEAYSPVDGSCIQQVTRYHYYTTRYANYSILSEDGRERYIFDDHGNHRSTIDTRTNQVLVSFSYVDGQVSKVTRPDAPPVRIERTSNEISLVEEGKAPFVLKLSDGYVAEAYQAPAVPTDPVLRRWAARYQPDGLMTSFWDPRGNRDGAEEGTPYRFTWEEVTIGGASTAVDGPMLLRTDTDPSGAVQILQSPPQQVTYEPIYGGNFCGQPVVTGWLLASQTSTVNHYSGEGRLTSYTTTASSQAWNYPGSFNGGRYLDRTARVDEPSGAYREWSDRRPDGTTLAAGPGWFSTHSILRERVGGLATTATSSTTTILAIAADGPIDSVARPALSVTESRTTTTAAGDLETGQHRTETTTTTRTAPGHLSRVSVEAYDGVTRVSTYTSPQGRSWSSVFDQDGRLIEVRAPGQVPTVFSYENVQLQGASQDTWWRSRLSQISRSKAGSRRTTRLSDYEGNYPQVLTARVSSSRSLVSIVETNSDGFSTAVGIAGQAPAEMTPDESLNTTAVTPPNRPSHGLGYDVRGLAVSYAPPGAVETENPSQCPSGTQCVVYNRDRQPAQVRLSGGDTVAYLYRSDGLLQTLTVPGSGDTAYEYDNRGRATSATASDGGSVTWSYQAALPVRTSWVGTHEIIDGPTHRVVRDPRRTRKVLLLGLFRVEPDSGSGRVHSEVRARPRWACDECR